MDWDKALVLALARRDSERDRLDRIEGKIAPVIAGTIAGLLLFVDKAASSADYFVGALLLVPLLMLFLAFRTFWYMDVPDLDELVRTYEWYPQSYIRAVVLGTAKAVAKNAPIIDRKARDLNRAMVVLFVTIVVVLSWRTFEALNHERFPIQAAPTTRSTNNGQPTPGTTNAGNGASLYQEGRQAP